MTCRIINHGSLHKLLHGYRVLNISPKCCRNPRMSANVQQTQYYLFFMIYFVLLTFNVYYWISLMHIPYDSSSASSIQELSFRRDYLGSSYSEHFSLQLNSLIFKFYCMFLFSLLLLTDFPLSYPSLADKLS